MQTFTDRTGWPSRWIAFAGSLLAFALAAGAFALPGDVNLDGRVDPLDQLAIQEHILGLVPMEGLALYAADANVDTVVDAADLVQLGFVFPTLVSSSPSNFEEGVSVTRETILRFSRALDPDSVGGGSIFATFAGQRLPARFNISPDRHTVTIFFDPLLPASARVRVTIFGDMLRSAEGLLVDADGDGLPGGIEFIDFDTLSLTSFPGTTVTGRVFASELVAGSGSSVESLNLPLRGVRISVAGADGQIFAVTDAAGNFRLNNAPAGRFFAHIDGRTVSSAIIDGEEVDTSYPAGPYFPFVGKAWTPVPGHEVSIGDVFLPLILAGTLQPASAEEDVTVGFAPEVLERNPGLAGVSVTVPADSLYSDNGTRGGRVGIAPVAPDRIPGPLPGGLEFPLVITVQTDGASNFDVPAPACFPNLPDPGTGQPLPPGTKNFLYSFNHDKGVWESVGPMTVSEDGTLICTDAGVGIKQPGWHGTAPDPWEPPPDCPDCCPFFAPGGASGGGAGPLPEGGLSAPRNAGLNSRWGSVGVAPPPPDDGLVARLDASLARPDTLQAGSKCTTETVQQKNCRECSEDEVSCPITVDTACVAYNRLLSKNCEGRACGIAEIADNIVQCEARLKSCESLKPYCERICARSGLTGMAQAGGGIIDEIRVFLAEAEGLIAPYLAARQDVPASVINQLTNIILQIDAIAGGDASAFLRSIRLEDEQGELALDTELGPRSNTAPPYGVLYAAHITRNGQADALILRGKTEPLGQYALFVPSDGEVDFVAFHDPVTDQSGIMNPWLTPDVPFRLRNFYLFPDEDFGDLDGDGLSDLAEDVYGTDPLDTDSDDDGVPDGAETDQGTNPLDGLPAFTGVIASADTPGTAKDVFALNDLAVVADGESGVSVFNVFNGLEPRIIAQVDTPGDALRAVLSGRFVIVADGPGGVAIIDIIDPPSARILHQLTSAELGGAVQSVAVAGDVAYAGLDSGDLVAIDLIRGVEIGRVSTEGSPVHDLGFAGDRLLALYLTGLRAFDVRQPNPRLLGSYFGLSYFAEGLTGSRRLFAADDRAYVTGYPGYEVFDVGNPAAITLLGFPPTSFGVPNSFKQIVLNGSGLGLAAVGTNPSGAVHDVHLFDTSDPAITTAFLTLFETPGRARAVSIFNGKVFAADDEAGLQVINYLPYDAQGTSPTISLSASFALDPGEAEEGSIGRITADVTDDVQARNVEFYINGVLAVKDGSFPFEHRFRIARSRLGATFRVHARAIDTGGNHTDSPEFTITIVPDATPPVVVEVSPADGLFIRGRSELSATFSESLNPATVTGPTFTLLSAGADLRLDTGDDAQITTVTLSYNDTVHSAFLTPAEPLAPGLYRATVTPPISDLEGNVLAAPLSWAFFVFGDTDTDHDGVPDVLEAELGLDPGNPDSDGDTIPDGLEDFDGDGLANQTEILVQTDPRIPDTDADGVSDADEDADRDDLTNAQEIALGTNLVVADTDSDGWPDGTEVQGGADPMNPASIPVKTVGSQPVATAVLVPRLDGSGPLPYNTVGSRPSAAGVLVPRLDGSGPLPYNTVGSIPPVSVEYAP